MRAIAFILSLILIFMIPWEDVVNLPGLGTVARSMGLVVALFWVATVLYSGRVRKPSLFHIMACLFVLWNALSILWSGNADRTAVQILTLAQLLGLTFILWDLYTTRAALWIGLEMYILGAYVALGSAVANYFSGSAYYFERFSATGTNPDDLGIILALGIPIAWYLAVSINIGRGNTLLKLINYLYIPAALLGIALSGTRTALIAAVPGLVFGVASLTRLRLWARVAIFLSLLVAVYFLLPFVPLTSVQRLSTTGSELAGGDLNGRTTIWRQGFASFAEHPLIGVGSSMFRSVNTVGKMVGKVAHNSFLSILVEVGLVGFLLFGIMLAIVVAQAWRQPRWEAAFWLTILATWAIGASTLTWENRKPTWLFLSLVVVSANLVMQQNKSAAKTPQQLVNNTASTAGRRHVLIGAATPRVGK
jgi:hypothetical protein